MLSMEFNFGEHLSLYEIQIEVSLFQKWSGMQKIVNQINYISVSKLYYDR
jgi:hypothetical protein